MIVSIINEGGVVASECQCCGTTTYLTNPKSKLILANGFALEEILNNVLFISNRESEDPIMSKIVRGGGETHKVYRGTDCSLQTKAYVVRDKVSLYIPSGSVVISSLIN